MTNDKTPDAREELLPCPFCGGGAQLFDSGFVPEALNRFHVQCNNGCVLGRQRATERQATEDWNTRYDAGRESAAEVEREWLPIDLSHTSLRWLFMLDKNKKEGIRLGCPEDGGWRLVNENGISTWTPHFPDHYLAEMPLDAPVDVSYPQEKNDE